MKTPINQELISSFNEKYIPEPNTGCWLWTASVNQKGYGTIYVRGSNRSGKAMLRAHRLSYLIHIGPIPDGLQIDHLCQVRGCVNPDHLEAVTPGENTRRGDHWCRSKTHCPQGHEYSPENTNRYLDAKGNSYRTCRTCRAMRHGK